ncbi:MAG TPA: hypothetical protein ENJ82_10495, partial [Bacteroidetes bacterium]|nr:hypothetical protein [Bacteroidota bacterium]
MKNRNTLNSNQIYRFLFFLLPILYFILYGFYGFCDTDQGFIPALSYRMAIGEMPVRDFIYVRPPLSPLIHTLEQILLPESLEILGSRLLFYVFIWLSILFGLLSLKRFLKLEEMGVSPWLIGGLAFVLAVHNYPPMPWHTLDGILLAAMGVYVASRGPQWFNTIFGLSLMGLSALAKQPFGVVPLGGVALLFLLYPWKRALLGTVGALVVACSILLALEMSDPETDFVQGLIAQATGATSLNDLRYGAYQLYVRPVVAMFGLVWLVWAILHYGLKYSRAKEAIVAMIWLGFLAMFAIHVYSGLKTHSFVPPRMGFYHTLLFSGGWMAFMQFMRKRDRKAMAILLLLCLINWASGISWGFSIPVLFA